MILLLLLSLKLSASTFFVPDSDTAALIAVVSNTASTVSNTMKILEVAKKTSEKIDKYHFIATRRLYMARRIEAHAKALAKNRALSAKSLEEFNRALFALKVNMRSLESSMDSLASDVLRGDDFVERATQKIALSRSDLKEAHKQEISSASEGKSSKHVQNTAMNTALSSKILSQMREDQLDYQRHDLSLKKNQTMEKLRADEHYRRWIGLPERSSEGALK